RDRIAVQAQELYAPRDLVGHTLAVRLGVVPQLKVLGPEVSSVADDVMDRLGVAQRATEFPFHHDPVNQHLAFAPPECRISATPFANPSLRVSPPIARALPGAVAPGALLPPALEPGPAEFADLIGDRLNSRDAGAPSRTVRREESVSSRVPDRANECA